jgi:hypothetical protein
VRGSNQNLRAEVAWYLDLEVRAQKRWAREMALLDSLDPSPQTGAPVVRLSVEAGSAGNGPRHDAIRHDPTVRLAVSDDGKPSNERRYSGALGKDPTARLAVANYGQKVDRMFKGKEKKK